MTNEGSIDWAKTLGGRQGGILGTKVFLRDIEIRTQKLTIKQFTDSDITAEYISWLNDSDHMRFSNQRFVRHTPDSCRRFLSTFDGSTSQFLGIHSNGRLVGTATVYLIPEHRTADIGILIGPLASNAGLGSETVSALAEELLLQGVRKITLGTSSANLAMQRVLAKIGFKPDGRRSRHEIIDGVEYDLVYFARFGITSVIDDTIRVQ